MQVSYAYSILIPERSFDKLNKSRLTLEMQAIIVRKVGTGNYLDAHEWIQTLAQQLSVRLCSVDSYFMENIMALW